MLQMKIAAGQVAKGMYVSNLDRPWMRRVRPRLNYRGLWSAGMVSKRHAVWTSVAWLCYLAACTAAESAEPPLDCDDPVNSGPAAVRQILGALYRAEVEAVQLALASEELDHLVVAATYCRAHVQSPGSGASRDVAIEWMMLHQWITRFADFVSLNAKGQYRVDWEAEYAEFAELYELEI